jgi:hypothetical protein
MSFHQLTFTPEGQYRYSDSKEPPETLPVMFDGEEVALGVFAEDTYSFNLPDKIGARIDFFDLEPVFVYGQTGNGWSTAAGPDDELRFILIQPRSDSETPAEEPFNGVDGVESQGLPGSNANV